MNHYYLHIGASLLPGGLRPVTLAEAIHRACGHSYATVYRVASGKPVPIVAGADEAVFVPTGRRVLRDTVAWQQIFTDMELRLAMMG